MNNPTKITLLKSKKTHFWFYVSYFILSSIISYSSWVGITYEITQRALGFATTMAIGLDGEMLRSLKANLEGEKKIEYQSIKNRIISALNNSKDIRSIYLYTMKNNKLFFLVDSDMEGTEFYSPLGQEYRDAHPEYFKPFIDGKPLITDSIVDRLGSWKSALIPIKGSTNQIPFAVLGVDYESHTWNKEIISRLIWVIALLIVIFLLIIFYFRLVINIIELKQSQALSKTIIDSIPGTFYMIGHTGKYIGWNDYQRDKIVGKSNDDMRNVYAIDTIHPDDRSMINSKIFNVLQDGKEEVVEGRVLMNGGPDFKWLIMTGRRMFINDDPALIGIGIDITDKKVALEKLTESEEIHRLLFKTSPDALVTLAPPDWNFTTANPALIKLFGAKDELDFISRPPWEYSPLNQANNSSSKEKAREMIKIAMRQGSHTFDWIHKRLNSDEFHARVVLTRIDTNHGSYLQANVKDLTEMIKTEEENKKLQTQIIHSSKLASIGTLAAGVAHEINNPLSIIYGNAELMSKTCKDMCQQGNIEKIRIIKESVERISAIVSGLRTYARQDNEKIERVDIHQSLERTLDFVESIFTKENVRIERKLAAKVYGVRANAGKFQQVVMNMLSNAKDALAGIAVGLITVETYNIDNLIVITISDNGTGVSTKDISKLFDPFFTTKEPGKGTGLGLSISYSIIESFKGHITVESVEKQGTTFKISLPLDESAQIQRVEKVIRPQSFEFHKKILFVDDEKHFRAIMSCFLKELGADVVEASNGEIALEILKKEKFDLVMTDVQMPKMTGLQLLSEVKAIDGLQTKFILLTGGIITDYSEEQQKIIKEQVSGIIYKPFDFDSITKLLADFR